MPDEGNKRNSNRRSTRRERRSNGRKPEVAPSRGADPGRHADASEPTEVTEPFFFAGKPMTADEFLAAVQLDRIEHLLERGEGLDAVYSLQDEDGVEHEVGGPKDLLNMEHFRAVVWAAFKVVLKSTERSTHLDIVRALETTLVHVEEPGIPDDIDAALAEIQLLAADAPEYDIDDTAGKRALVEASPGIFRVDGNACCRLEEVEVRLPGIPDRVYPISRRRVTKHLHDRARRDSVYAWLDVKRRSVGFRFWILPAPPSLPKEAAAA